MYQVFFQINNSNDISLIGSVENKQDISTICSLFTSKTNNSIVHIKTVFDSQLIKYDPGYYLLDNYKIYIVSQNISTGYLYNSEYKTVELYASLLFLNQNINSTDEDEINIYIFENKIREFLYKIENSMSVQYRIYIFNSMYEYIVKNIESFISEEMWKKILHISYDKLKKIKSFNIQLLENKFYSHDNICIPYSNEIKHFMEQIEDIAKRNDIKLS